MHIPFLLQGAQANPSMTTPSPSGTSSTPSALSTHTIATGNMPIALSTLGTAGQYNAQFAGLPRASSNVGIGTAATLSSPAQYTNTTQASSSGVTPEQYLGDIASTVGNLGTSVSDWLTAQGPLLQGGGPRSVRIPKSVHHRERG